MECSDELSIKLIERFSRNHAIIGTSKERINTMEQHKHRKTNFFHALNPSILVSIHFAFLREADRPTDVDIRHNDECNELVSHELSKVCNRRQPVWRFNLMHHDPPRDLGLSSSSLPPLRPSCPPKTHTRCWISREYRVFMNYASHGTPYEQERSQSRSSYEIRSRTRDLRVSRIGFLSFSFFVFWHRSKLR